MTEEERLDFAGFQSSDQLKPDEGVEHTPQQMLYRLAEMDLSSRIFAAGSLLASAREADVCHSLDHEGQITALRARLEVKNEAVGEAAPTDPAAGG